MRKFYAFLSIVIIAFVALGTNALYAYNQIVNNDECGVIDIELTGYGSADPSYADFNNSIVFSVDGKLVYTSMFNQSFDQSFDFDYDVDVDYVVEVNANLHSGAPDDGDIVIEDVLRTCSSVFTIDQRATVGTPLGNNIPHGDFAIPISIEIPTTVVSSDHPVVSHTLPETGSDSTTYILIVAAIAIFFGVIATFVSRR